MLSKGKRWSPLSRIKNRCEKEEEEEEEEEKEELEEEEEEEEEDEVDVTEAFFLGIALKKIKCWKTKRKKSK